jgi:hypothetical protein
MKKQSISSFCRENGFNIQKTILFLLQNNIIKEEKVLYSHKKKLIPLNKKYTSNNIETNKLVLNSIIFLEYIKTNNFEYLLYLNEEDKNINIVTNNIIKREKFNNIFHKTILFLDFEYKSKYYSEVGMIISKNGVKLEEYYIFSKNSIRSNRVLKKVNYLIKNNIKFEFMNKSKIDALIRKKMKEVDLIVGFHVNSEMNVLRHININTKNYKFVCLAELFSTVLTFKTNGKEKQYPNLEELKDFLQVKPHSSGFKHCSLYDADITKLCFEKLYFYLNKKNEILNTYPLIIEK